MENTQKKNEFDQILKDTNLIKEQISEYKNDKSMVFKNYMISLKGKAIFRYRRFVGTVKHKKDLYYEQKYLGYKNDLLVKINHIKDFVNSHKRQMLITTSLLAVTVFGIGLYEYNTGYLVTFNGQELGIIREQETFTKAIGVVNRELSSWYNNNIVFEQEVIFEKTFINRDKLLANVDESVKAVYSTDIEVSVSGAVIIVNGQEVVNLSSVDHAEKVIDGVLAPFISESQTSKLVGEAQIAEEYSIEEKVVNYGTIMNIDNAIAYISQGTEEVNEYQVKTGDTSWDIAVNRGININDLQTANPSMDITNLHDGDVLKLTVEKPFFTVSTVKEETTEQKIAYNTVYQNDSSVYVGKTKVIKSGENGIKHITSRVSYENGSVVSSEVISEEVLKNPVDQIVAKGTKALPPGQGTGRFRMPTSGRVSTINKPGSHAGSRAVDIVNKTGTGIYASDSGVVTKASNTGNGYGNCIIIDHGSGYSTLYGHLSSYKVSVGDRVSRGQLIAGMGNTGRSYGTHLHFEVRINGARQVIYNYFPNLAKGRYVSP